MKKIRLFSAFVLLSLLVSSCASLHTGYIANSAALNSGNFLYVQRNIKGVSSAKYLFGIGGFGKETLVNDAKQDMLINSYPIKDKQALVNLTVNFKTTVVMLIFTEVKCIVTADVVQFTDDSAGSR